MTQKPKAMKKKEGGERVRRKAVPWASDRATADGPSSFEVLMTWLTTPGNGERWRREKRATLCREIITTLQQNGIPHRELGDVQHKIWQLENQFVTATGSLARKNQLDAFQRGEASQEIEAEVTKLCPQFRELWPVFAKSAMGKAMLVAKGAVVVEKSAAGKWKETLEKDRRKIEIQAKKLLEAKGERATSGGNGREPIDQKARLNGASDGDKKASNKSSAENGLNVAGKFTLTVPQNGALGTTKANTADENKSTSTETNLVAASANGKSEELGKGQVEYVVVDDDEETEVAAADVVEIQGVTDGKRESDEVAEGDTEESNIVEQEEAQGDTESEAEGSEEEEALPPRRAKVKRVLKTIPQLEPEESSSEESGEEESEDSQDEQDDGEERIQLAQPDETEEEQDDDGSDEADEDKMEDVEEVEEEEVEEEPKHDSSKAAKESSEDSDSSSSASESADNEEEVPPTQLKANSDHEEESDQESRQEENEEGDEDAKKPVEDSDSDDQLPVQQRTTRKRSSSNEASPPTTTKRGRTETNSNEVTRDLEREAYIARAKQERDQRDELFQLERAKLECELQAKQVQLAMERSLARKKLLGAGVDPAEVNRVLPL